MVVPAAERQLRANAVEPSGEFEQLAFGVAQPGELAGLVEQRERQGRDVMLVGIVAPVLARQLDHRAAPYVRDLRPDFEHGAVPIEPIEHHAFAQRCVAQRDFLGACGLQELEQQHAAQVDRVGALLVDTGQLSACFSSRLVSFCRALPARHHCALTVARADCLPSSACLAERANRPEVPIAAEAERSLAA
jgi:hypothetical protein